jgi:recombination protein RecA
MGTITKVHGASSLVSLAAEPDFTVPRQPTGVFAIDDALDGGFPKGRMVELAGPEGGGKSSISLRTAAEAQKEGRVVLIDAENGFDPIMAEKSGVNIRDLYMSQPDTAEQALEILEMLVVADDISLIIVDSVAALLPRAELEGDYGDAHVALLPRLLSQGMRKLGRKMQEVDSQATLIWINQLREKIGTFGYGPTTISPGGRALKHACATRLEVTRMGQVKQGEDIIGHTVLVKVNKARTSPPGRRAQFDIIYSTGIANESTVLDLAVKQELVDKSGSWYTDKTTGQKLGQGRLGASEFLRLNPDVMESIRSLLI